MSDSSANNPGSDPASGAWNFSKMVPGLEFLQQWTKSAGAALPAMGQWVAPTLDPAEIDKRINELRTVQFWLEQNVRMLAMTIQALEVQRMTLNTLQGMNVPVDALRETLKAQTSGAASQQASPDAPPQTTPPGPSSPFTAAFAAPFGAAGGQNPFTTNPQAGTDATGNAVDPMRWWGSITQQFAQLASHAMQDALKEGPAGQAKTSDQESAPSGEPPQQAGSEPSPDADAAGPNKRRSSPKGGASNTSKGGQKGPSSRS